MLSRQRVSVGALILWSGVAGSLATGCYQTPDSAELRIKLVDTSEPKSPKPMAGALIAIETGGLYVTNPDPSQASPSYKYGGRAGDDGTLIMTLPTDTIGVHSFATGYYYGSRLVPFDQDLGITINMEPFRTPFPPLPTITNPTLSAVSVAPGAEFTISCEVKAGEAADPLSDEVIVTIPAENRALALAPPSAGVQGKGYPDGTWSLQLVAPGEPGSYEYFLSATSEGCVTGDLGPALVLEVK
ncbi:MAG: hypothetical protein IPI67_22480 [Myxococcales bacterium]|nr:hypothetical protein [Myxococcales bacterium]